MRFIKVYGVSTLVLASLLALAACSDSGSSVPTVTGTTTGTGATTGTGTTSGTTGTPGANSPVGAVTLTNGGTKASFIPGGSLPSPSTSIVNPRVIAATQTVQPASPLPLNVHAGSPVDEILIGLPGNQGYFDLNVRGVALSAIPFDSSAYPVTVNLTTAAPTLIPLGIQTISGGVASGITTLNVAPSSDPRTNIAQCGGGNVTVNFSQVMNTNASTSPGTFRLSVAYYNSSPSNATSISAGGCSNAPGEPIGQFSILLPGKPVAGHTYLLSTGGIGNSSVAFSDGTGFWVSATGSLVVQTVTNQTLTFNVHASMQPEIVDANVPGSASGTFIVDLSGTVGITGL